MVATRSFTHSWVLLLAPRGYSDPTDCPRTCLRTLLCNLDVLSTSILLQVQVEDLVLNLSGEPATGLTSRFRRRRCESPSETDT